MSNQSMDGAPKATSGPSAYYVRQTALDAALKTSHAVPGADAVVRAAKAYLDFLTTNTKEQN